MSQSYFLKIPKGRVKATIHDGPRVLHYDWPSGVTIAIVADEEPKQIIGFPSETYEHKLQNPQADSDAAC